MVAIWGGWRVLPAGVPACLLGRCLIAWKEAGRLGGCLVVASLSCMPSLPSTCSEGAMDSLERFLLIASSDDVTRAIDFATLDTIAGGARTQYLGMALQNVLRQYTNAAATIVSELLSFTTKFAVQASDNIVFARRLARSCCAVAWLACCIMQRRHLHMLHCTAHLHSIHTHTLAAPRDFTIW